MIQPFYYLPFLDKRQLNLSLNVKKKKKERKTARDKCSKVKRKCFKSCVFRYVSTCHLVFTLIQKAEHQSEQIFDMGGPSRYGWVGDLEEKGLNAEDTKLLNGTAQSGDKWCPKPAKWQSWPLNQSEVTVEVQSRLPPPWEAAIW